MHSLNGQWFIVADHEPTQLHYAGRRPLSPWLLEQTGCKTGGEGEGAWTLPLTAAVREISRERRLLFFFVFDFFSPKVFTLNFHWLGFFLQPFRIKRPYISLDNSSLFASLTISIRCHYSSPNLSYCSLIVDPVPLHSFRIHLLPPLSFDCIKAISHNKADFPGPRANLPFSAHNWSVSVAQGV